MNVIFSSLYRLFPARAPLKNSTAYNDLIKFAPDIPDGLDRTAGQQAAYQTAGLVLSIAFGIFGGLLTGKLILSMLSVKMQVFLLD